MSSFGAYCRPTTPAMDSDCATDSDTEDGLLPPSDNVVPSIAAAAGGITFISPFAASLKTGSTFLPPAHQTSPTAWADPAHAQRSKSLADGYCRRGSYVVPSIRYQMEDLDKRRNSVDAAVLAEFSTSPSGVGHRRASKRQRADSRAGDQETPVQSQAVLAQAEQAQPHTEGRETAFADHLTAILNHSLSLCSGQGETLLDMLVRTEPSAGSPSILTSSSDDSPRSSFSGPALSPKLSPSAENSSVPPATRIQRLPSIPDMLSPVKRIQLIAKLQEWGFNALELDADELWECASIMFECVMCMEGVESGISMDRMRALILALRSAYHARNGYHNFAHATDVLQAIYSFLVASQVAPPLSFLHQRPQGDLSTKWKRSAHVNLPGAMGDLLRPMDVFALMIAAIGHDVGHPGLSNAYMVNARTPVAQVYGNKSILENFHTVTLVQMLRQHGLGHLFGGVTRNSCPSDPDCRKVLFASVLATDMSQHFPFVAKLQEMALRLKDHKRLPSEVEEDRLLLCSGLMKCADISNPTRPHDVAKIWSTALLEEWTVQAQIETDFELPISVMVLNPAEAKAQAKSQVGFINLFTLPLFDAMASSLPEFKKFSDACREGRRVWEAIVLQPDPSSSPIHPSLSPNATPKAPHLSQMASDVTAEDQSRIASRRRPPPRSLNIGKGHGSRGSCDSSSGVSASSPSLSPFSGSGGRFPSFSSVSSVESPRESAAARLQCTGMCGEVTAKCYSCLQREQDCESDETVHLIRDPSIRTEGIFDSVAVYSTEDAFSQDVWPPYPFYPCSSS